MDGRIRSHGEVQVVGAGGEAGRTLALQAEVEDVAFERRVIAEVEIGVGVATVQVK